MPNTRALHRRAVPEHVAIIMDGNGRWATRRGMPRLAGHKRGVERVREIVEACPGMGVKHLTLFAFSTENWKRSSGEVNGLMRLFRWYIRKESARLLEAGVRMRFIGMRHRLSADLQAMMTQIEELTAENTDLTLTVAIDYGGRCEILRAARKMAEAAKTGAFDLDDLSEDSFGQFLDTDGLPDPDLVLRTSGEVRISNYLLWQAAYAEYDFLDICWPDFTAETLAQCIASYGERDRRFGAVAG
ncbi:polyprenyl diphosphate synthase [Algicella marina]|uniref:Isoprenyl transferase n=1 Tax=Algicella marina TaxID=2683284 RepID=A0A6P1SZB6_9RHOB|nr:polyprenyl diphosphate synthase [Algicella marina]QHQ34713.1 di-trans,poly-cis-decaprenylcistransferase [Algicella marina]